MGIENNSLFIKNITENEAIYVKIVTKSGLKYILFSNSTSTENSFRSFKFVGNDSFSFKKMLSTLKLDEKLNKDIKIKLFGTNKNKIYQIEPIQEHDENDRYIGSTTKTYLSERMAQHRYGYNKFKSHNLNRSTLYEIFDKYGIENCKIILKEEYSCNTKMNYCQENHITLEMSYVLIKELKIEQQKRKE